MSRFEEYNRLIYGETIGWFNGERITKELPSREYNVLLSLLVHRKTRLRWSAADRLGKIGDDRAVKPLIQALHDAHWLVRLHTAKALGRIGNSIAIEPLIELLNDECPYVRRRVVTALADLNNEGRTKITEVLISALTDSDSWVRAHAVFGLRKKYSRSVISAVASAVGDGSDNVSWRAIEALVEIGKPAVKSLVPLLDWPDSEIRYRVVKALGLIGDRRATRPLKRMLSDPNEKVRWRTRMALSQIKSRTSWEKMHSKLRRLWYW